MASQGKAANAIPATGKSRVVIVRTEWNAAIVDELAAGCRRALKKNKTKIHRELVVPGAFEIPFAIKQYWENTRNRELPDAFIALGCVIRGDTPHFDYICKGVTDGIVGLNLRMSIPVIFGILTTDNAEQARERIGGAHGHKGVEAAEAAIKMIALNQSILK